MFEHLVNCWIDVVKSDHSNVSCLRLACKLIFFWAFLIIDKRKSKDFVNVFRQFIGNDTISENTRISDEERVSIRFMQIAKCILYAFYVFYNPKHTYLYSVTILMYISVREHALSVRRNKILPIKTQKTIKNIYSSWRRKKWLRYLNL